MLQSSDSSSKRGFIIAIDGPVAAGKGTIAKALAERVGGFHLYTGAMYRCLALYCIENTIDLLSKEEVVKAMPLIAIDFPGEKVLLNNHDVTGRIKQRDVAQGSSDVAVLPEVRQEMVKRQQELGKSKTAQGERVVIEGRDTVTRVFPDADFKLFLTARPEIRAKRRLEQLQTLGDNQTTLDSVLEDTKKRDEQDTTRDVDPLVSEPEKYGYFVLDNSDINESQTIDAIVEQLRKKGLLS